MAVTEASFTDETGAAIRAVIDGIGRTVPDDPENRHRQLIAEWEAAGNAIAAYEAPPDPVPDTVSARHLRLALHGAGLLADVAPAIAAMPEAERVVAEIEWEYATSFERAHPMIVQLGAALGLDAAGIDDIFLSALSL